MEDLVRAAGFGLIELRTEYAGRPRPMTYCMLEACAVVAKHRVTARSSKVDVMSEHLAVCSKCGNVNHVIPSRPAADAICEKCNAKMFAGPAIENLGLKS